MHSQKNYSWKPIQNFIRQNLFFVFLWSLCSVTYADSTSDELAKILNSVHSMRAQFAQTIYDTRGKAIQKSSGRMALERPGKFRWQVTQPMPQLIIANASRLWIYDPDLQQVTIRPIKKVTGETPALLLSQNNTGIDSDFTVKEVQQNKPDWRYFALTPKKEDSMFMKVQLGFLNNKIREMLLIDHLGHTTNIQFQEIETNVHFANSQFNFKPPAHVDVIDETRTKK